MQQMAAPTYTLVDGREFPLQDADIAERIVSLTASLGIPPTRRTALVAPHPVDRAQARSAASLVDARYFMSVESAKNWLFSEEA